MKVRIGYGIGTQGLADGGARFAELIDALEELQLRLDLVLRARHGTDPRTHGVAGLRRRVARRS